VRPMAPVVGERRQKSAVAGHDEHERCAPCGSRHACSEAAGPGALITTAR
jgi:hypothetical protein